MTVTVVARAACQKLRQRSPPTFALGLSSRRSRSLGASPHAVAAWQAPLAVLFGTAAAGGSWNLREQQQQQHLHRHRTHCDAGAALVVVPPPPPLELPAWRTAPLSEKVLRAWRLLKRMIKLAVTMAPIVAFYPVVLLLLHHGGKLGDEQQQPRDAQQIVLLHQDDPVPGFLGWYLRTCLSCVERSGAAVIKLMQWAGSRPDLFGSDFCAVFSKLQDHTTPHRWHHTERALREAYGDDWHEAIELNEIIGSGCIGQVYRGIIKTGRGGTAGSANVVDGERQCVAVKVLHPSVYEDIDADLDLMRVAVRAVKYLPFDVFANLKWLNMEGVVEEFAALLKLQIDLRREAANLERFNENFKADAVVQFPKLVPGFAPSDKVLVETFCEGVPVLQFCRDNKDNQPLLSNLCVHGIRAVCKMIFLDNFVHGTCTLFVACRRQAITSFIRNTHCFARSILTGDLHPGNVFVSPDGKKFILFDVGIVNEYRDDDHDLIIDVLAAFIRKKGRIAGRRMIDDSNSKLRSAHANDAALEEERYIDKIEHLTTQAATDGYFMEHLGAYISYICESAAKHHVMMNPAFVSAALAVKIQEGIALAMDPACEIPKIAIPVIVESERRRMTGSAAATFGRLKRAFFGDT